MTATQFEALVGLLAEADVEFVLVGGLAAVIHGSAHVTYDLDVCYGRSPANIERLLVIPDLEALLELRKPPTG